MSIPPPLPPAVGLERKPTPLPQLAEPSEAHLQAALAASARAEATLSALSREIQRLGSGVGGAREANESLTLELEALRELLGRTGDQQLTFEGKVEELEAVLDRTRHEHARERTFLIEQQDRFLVELLDEQEAELKRRDAELEILRGRVVELERRAVATVAPARASAPGASELAPPSAALGSAASELELTERSELERMAQKLAEDRERARETVARLQTQRDEAQNAVARITKERDEALSQIYRLKSELGGPRIPHSTHPPAGELRRDSASARAALLAVELELEAGLSHPTMPSSPSSSAANGPSSAPGASSAQTSETPPISSVLSPPRSNPHAAPLPTRLSPPPARLAPQPTVVGRPSPPPEELRSALTEALPVAAGRPSLLGKSSAGPRPTGGYSLNDESVEAEHLEGARPSSRPTTPGGDKR